MFASISVNDLRRFTMLNVVRGVTDDIVHTLREEILLVPIQYDV